MGKKLLYRTPSGHSHTPTTPLYDRACICRRVRGGDSFWGVQAPCLFGNVSRLGPFSIGFHRTRYVPAAARFVDRPPARFVLGMQAPCVFGAMLASSCANISYSVLCSPLLFLAGANPTVPLSAHATQMESNKSGDSAGKNTCGVGTKSELPKSKHGGPRKQ